MEHNSVFPGDTLVSGSIHEGWLERELCVRYGFCGPECEEIVKKLKESGKHMVGRSHKRVWAGYGFRGSEKDYSCVQKPWKSGPSRAASGTWNQRGLQPLWSLFLV